MLSQANPRALSPHPWNSAIYGEDYDVTELISLIRDSGWVKRLVITPTGTIISGHRRWKAVLALGWESVPVEVREFPDSLAELEALLLENASRFKTNEQKVREGEAWSDIEKHRALQRQKQAAATTNQQLGRTSVPTLQENFPEASKGQTRDAIAHRIGLGSGRTYEKAASVVRAIDSLMEDIPEAAMALRKVLNKQSIDAAYQVVKKPTEERTKILAAIASGQAKTTKEAVALLQKQSGESEGGHKAIEHSAAALPSCWNCQNRGELIENHSFYCNRLGALSFLEKSALVRGTECGLWSYRWVDSKEANNKNQPTRETFTLTLPAYLQSLLQDAARKAGMSVVDWATWLLESEAKATSDSSAAQPTDKTSRHVAQCREP